MKFEVLGVSHFIFNISIFSRFKKTFSQILQNSPFKIQLDDPIRDRINMCLEIVRKEIPHLSGGDNTLKNTKTTDESDTDSASTSEEALSSSSSQCQLPDLQLPEYGEEDLLEELRCCYTLALQTCLHPLLVSELASSGYKISEHLRKLAVISVEGAVEEECYTNGERGCGKFVLDGYVDSHGYGLVPRTKGPLLIRPSKNVSPAIALFLSAQMRATC